MRRIVMLSLALTLMLTSSASFASVQNFSRFSCNVPDGWTFNEQSAGSAVTFDKDGTTNIVVELSKQSANSTPRTLEESANSVCTSRNGTNLVRNPDGSYTFIYYFATLRCTATLYDNQTDPDFPEGVSCLFTKADICDDADANMIRNSIVINSEWAGERTGTEQKFTRATVKVPSGWTGSEDVSGNIYIRKNDSNARIGLQILKMGTRTVQNMAAQAYSTFNGTGDMRDGRFGIYFYTSSGNVIFVFDNQIHDETHPGIPDGVCVVMHLEGGLYMDETDMVFESIVVDEDWANGRTPATPSGEGTLQKFTRISAKVPDGWTGSESTSGANVYITNNDNSSMRFSIQVVNKYERTLEAMANEAFSTYGGTGEIEHPRAGVYLFSLTRGGNIIVFDNEYSSNIREGWCCVVYGTAMTVPVEVLNMILDSVTINEEYIYNQRLDNDSKDGTVQTFTRVTVKIPDGWTGSENNTGDIIYITRNGTPASRIALQLMETEGRTLQAIAEERFTALNGKGELQEQSGVYMFQTEDDGAVFIFDDKHSKLPEGFCCLMLITGQNPGADLTTVQNSITINQSWLDNRNNGGNTSGDIGGNNGNNTSGDVSGNTSGNSGGNSGSTSGDIGGNISEDLADTGSGGGGGGCSSGLPAISLILYGLAFLRKK